jgi:hypothetical protein
VVRFFTVTHFTAETRTERSTYWSTLYAQVPRYNKPNQPTRSREMRKGKMRAAKMACGPSLTAVLEWV